MLLPFAVEEGQVDERCGFSPRLRCSLVRFLSDRWFLPDHDAPTTMRASLALALFASVLLGACDSTEPDLPSPPPDEPPAATNPVVRGAIPSNAVTLLRAQLYSRLGADVTHLPEDGEPDEVRFAHYKASLWLSGRQAGRDRFVGDSNALLSAYRPCLPNLNGYYSPFTLAAGVDYDLGEWPVDFGAPLTADGKPRVYGDVMTWDAFCVDAQTGRNNPPDPERTLQDIQVNTALFRYVRSDLSRVHFYRYEITNQGDEAITDIRAGFYSDPDVSGFYGNNLLGGTDRYATVYLAPVTAEGRPLGAVTGIGLLETPKATPLAVRRVEYRDGGPHTDPLTGTMSPPVLLTENGLGATPDAPIFAMRGLDDLGNPIVDPTTGQTTTLMYSGDPVAGTGWLDGTLPGGEDGWDLRVLQSTAPFTLAPGETVVLTAVTISVVGSDLADGLARLDRQFTAVAADPSLWRFPVANP